MQEIQKTIPIENIVNETLQLMKQFETLLKEETTALRAADFKKADKFKNDKKELSQGYHRHIQLLVNRKLDIAKLSPQIKENIIKSRLSFSKILAENMRVIDAVRQSSQRLVNKIIESARNAIGEDAGYSATGKIYSTASVRKSPVSISINETL